jgi:hypothetical protein
MFATLETRPFVLFLLRYKLTYTNLFIICDIQTNHPALLLIG